ncbi:hypothetical protein CP533_5322 [Ophiocordyceps camponoti-saundersi (nom. inval.)]|nr:hypothetical protein CP533_5322 [Ophiocordyceps camponoti-saundersi (nom. inval.)]
MQLSLSVKGTLALFTAASSLFAAANSLAIPDSSMISLTESRDILEPSQPSENLAKRHQKQRWDGCRLTVSVLAPGDLTMEFAQRFGADPENVRTPEMARSVQVMKDAIAVGDQVRAHDALYTNCQASVRDDAIKHNTGP